MVAPFECAADTVMADDLRAEGPNGEQIEYWNGEVGDKWTDAQERLDPVLEPFGLAAMDAAGAGSGDRSVDIGCGCGATTLELARRAGSSGSALGLDVSASMLRRARERAAAEGLRNAAFVAADAATHRFEDDAADLAYSRFGVMFFADPAGAFANLRSGLKRGGRLGFVCWRSLERNEWVGLPRAVALRHVPPPEPRDPLAPGPFAFADADRVRRVLDEAGFSGIEIAAHDVAMRQPGPVDEAVSFLVRFGPAGRLLAEADEATRRAVEDEVRRAIAGRHDGEGVDLDAAMWIATARA